MLSGFSLQFKDLKESMQIVFLGLLFITPICFCDLALFSRLFYKTNPLYLSIVVSFCVSIGMYLLSILVYAFSVHKTSSKNSGNQILFYSAIFTVFSLTVLTYIGYEINIGFKMYVRFILITSILTILIYSIIGTSSNESVNNKTQKSETPPKNSLD